MRLVIKDDPNAVADWVAAYVAARINNFAPTAKKPFVLGLPTGSSPLVTYKKASGALLIRRNAAPLTVCRVYSGLFFHVLLFVVECTRS